MKNITRKLALLLPVAALILALLVMATPNQARAADVNQCAGTVTETGSDLINSKEIMLSPQLNNTGAKPEGYFGASWPLGSIDLKITAAKGIKKGDYVTVSAKDKTEIRNVQTGYVTDAAGEKVAYVSFENGKVKVTWTEYAASQENISIDLKVIAGYSLNKSEFNKAENDKQEVTHQLTSCGSDLKEHKAIYSFGGFEKPSRELTALTDGDYFKGYITVSGDNSAAGAPNDIDKANTLYHTQYQLKAGLKADCDLVIAEDKDPDNNFGFGHFNQPYGYSISEDKSNIRRTSVVKGATDPAPGTFGIVCSADGKTVDIYYRSQGENDAQYAYFPVVSDGKKRSDTHGSVTGVFEMPYEVAVWANGEIYEHQKWFTSEISDGLLDCKINCGIVGKSSLSLNDAQVVGGSEKVDGDIPGTTYTYSPDKKFRLVQGERMYVEYVDKDAITDYSGQPQKIPGIITLRWPKAAYENKTGELLDVEITLSDVSLRVADYTNDYWLTNEWALREQVEKSFLVLMHNSICDPWRDDPTCDSTKNDIRENLSPYIGSLVANAVSIPRNPGDNPRDLIDSTSHLTYKFFTQRVDPKTGEKIESDQVGTTDIGYFRKPGMVGGPGNWSANWDQADPMQPHVKILSGGGCLRQPDRRIGSVFFSPGVKFGEERPCKQAWSQADHSSNVGEPFVNMNVKSGLTIELSNKEKTDIGLIHPGCINPHRTGKLYIYKHGEGSSVFTGKDSNGNDVKKAINGAGVVFYYKVENTGASPVWDIEVTDSKGVKVTCPKTVLVGGESMTCTGQGAVKSEPGK